MQRDKFWCLAFAIVIIAGLSMNAWAQRNVLQFTAADEIIIARNEVMAGSATHASAGSQTHSRCAGVRQR